MEFLLASQHPDGFWRDFLTPAGEASEWPTGFVGSVLQHVGARSSTLERAAAALLGSQRSDGGWGYNEGVPSDADSTAWGIRFLASVGHESSSLRRAAAFLARHQQPHSGGVATYSESGPIRRFIGVGRWVPLWGWCRPHGEVTAASGSAFASAGVEWALHARSAWRYVRSRQERNGCWRSYWWTTSHYATLQAVELAAAFDDCPALRRAAEWAILNAADGGGWSAAEAARSAFGTAQCLSIFVLARVNRTVIERAMEELRGLQEADGGWPSHPILRIPIPPDPYPEGRSRRRLIRFDAGLVVSDHHRRFTSAACVDALARATQLLG